MTETQNPVNEEKLLFDIIDYLKRQYDIDERQISTTRHLVGSVSLHIHDGCNFPGFGNSSVSVFDMSDEIRYGYVPHGNSIRVWTEKQEAPESK